MQPNLHTIIFVIGFAVIYMYFTARETARQRLDLYDLFMLSTVAVIPTVFVLLPGLAEYVAVLTGVAFPFVVMFGALFAILFVFVHRMTAKLHSLERDNRRLIQELSLLKASLPPSPTPDVAGDNV